MPFWAPVSAHHFFACSALNLMLACCGFAAGLPPVCCWLTAVLLLVWCSCGNADGAWIVEEEWRAKSQVPLQPALRTPRHRSFSGLGGWIQVFADVAREQSATVMNPGTEFGRLVTRPEVAEMSGCGWEEHGKAFWSRTSEALVTENGEPEVSIWINKPSVEAVRGTVMFKAELPALARQIRTFPHQARTIKVIEMMSEQDQHSTCYRNWDQMDFSACTCSDIGTAVKEELDRLLGQDLVVSVRLICTVCGLNFRSIKSLRQHFLGCYDYVNGWFSES